MSARDEAARNIRTHSGQSHPEFLERIEPRLAEVQAAFRNQAVLATRHFGTVK